MAARVRAQARPARAVLPGVGIIDPLRQGDLDGLCGVYSIINAIRLAAAPHRPLSTAAAEELFAQCICQLENLAALQRAVTSGMSNRAWRSIMRACESHCREALGLALTFERLFTWRDKPNRAAMLAAIDDAINAGRPVCLLLDNTLAHYTVIAGFSATRFRLFDSSTHHSISRDRCGPTARFRHALPPRWVFSLKLSG